MKNDLGQSAVNAGGSPSPTSIDISNLRIPRGIGIHFDPAAPPNTGAPAGSPPAGGAPGDGAGSPPAGSGAGSPPAGTPIDWNTAPERLRTEYQQTKSKLEPWEKLGAKPEDVQRSHQTYTKLFTEATTLGQQLNYAPEEIQQAFQNDPAGTLAVLRQAVKDAGGTEKPLTRAEVERLADLKAKEAMKPFQVEREQRLDSQAESRFDGEFDRQLKTSFPNGLPDSNREALSGLAWSLLIENKDGYGALRSKGDVTHVAQAFEQAKKTLLKIVADYGEHEKTRIGGTPPQAPGAGTKKAATLDDIINNLGNSKVPMEQVFTGR